MKNWMIFLGTLLSLPLIGQNNQGTILPQLGYGAHFEQQLIMEVPEGTQSVMVVYQPKNSGNKDTVVAEGPFDRPYNFAKIRLAPLEMYTTYTYEVYFDGDRVTNENTHPFTTRRLWEWREDAPDFSFLLGSCHYANDPKYDRPGKPYGRGNAIIRQMVEDTADFNLLTGDNIYLREVDWSSVTGIYYRYHHYRQDTFVSLLLHKRPTFATWDDHDFGPNNSNRAYPFKDIALQAFKANWGNPTFGMPGVPGVFGQFEWSDCDFFLLDNRYYRSPEWYADSLNGDWNPDKAYLGNAQLQWLKDALANSRAPFKFIVSGSQVINTAGRGECFCDYQQEWEELLNFIRDNDVRGVVFLSGDRHMSEILKLERQGMYPLYEITSSPISAGPYTSVLDGPEADNPLRVDGTLYPDINYMKLSVSGERGRRVLTVSLKNKTGETVWTHQLHQQDLRISR